MKVFYNWTSRAYNWVWFWIVFIYVGINWLNSVLVDYKIGAKARSKVRVRVSLKSRFKKLQITELDILRVLLLYIVALLFYVMALLGMKSLFSLLKIVKLYKRFFQSVVILE